MKFELQQWPVKAFVANIGQLSIPSFQRESDVWPSSKQKLFIDTIIKGWKTPKLYLNQSEEQFEIIDGQQRIYAVLDFIENPKKKITISGQNLSYHQLDNSIKEQILNYKFDVEVISDAVEDEVSQLFSRLQAGVALNASEKINAITGKLSDFVLQMEDHVFFTKATFRQKRYGIKSMCQQLCVLEIRGIGSTKFPKALDFFEENKNFDDNTKKEKIIKTLDFMNDIFVNQEWYLGKGGNVLSIYLICSWLLDSKIEFHPQRVYSFFKQFYDNFEKKTETNHDYRQFYLTLLQATADNYAIVLRDDVLKSYLYLKEPILIKNLQNDEKEKFYERIESKLKNEIEQIKELMRTINNRSIVNGNSRIFTMTTQTSFTLTDMYERIKNPTDYDKFVTMTWKTFYEASNSGNKIPGFSSLKSGPDVKTMHVLTKLNFLRTEKAHDTELNQDTSDKIIKTAAEVRQYYSGKKLVDDFEEIDYLVLQFNVISEILEFLLILNSELK